MNLIELKGIYKYYGNYAALNNIHFHIEKGEIYGLIGKNGAGKSTLFKVIMGLAHEDQGTISMWGSDHVFEGRAKIGFMMDPHFFPYMNAYENLRYCADLMENVEDEEIMEVLKEVGLDRNHKPYSAYSMGMRQRLAVGSALLGHPELIILDEPVNGLDPQGIVEFRDLIQNLNENKGITFLLSSHILSELGLLAHRFGFMHEGVLLEEQTAKNLKQFMNQRIQIQSQNMDSLKDFFKDKAYTISKDKFIFEDKGWNHKTLIQTLLENEVDFEDANIESLNVEDYYLSLIEGEKHD